MVIVYPYKTLGHANHGWLDARHHFSFASYVNSKRNGFGALWVINDDKVAANNGFSMHPHENMEIITYVRQGAITHKDSLGNHGKTNAGDVQVMSAGTGVFHSEYNLENNDSKLYQIWITPNIKNVTPRWEAKTFPKDIKNQFILLVSGQLEHRELGALNIHQDAAVYGANIMSGITLEQNIKHKAYILAVNGQFRLNGKILNEGDGAEVTLEKKLIFTAITNSEVLIIDVP